jgi:hypothetical protein
MSIFRLDMPRTYTNLVAECYASPELFFPWDDLSEKAQMEFQVGGSIPCDGSGHPGMWCVRCRFGNVECTDL